MSAGSAVPRVFCRLGAQAEAAGRVLTIAPGGLLRGTEVEAPDLRGGAALVLAGLAARGTTVITHPAHIDRGYAGFTEILAGLGAQIRRESATGNGTVKKSLCKKTNLSCNRGKKMIRYSYISIVSNSSCAKSAGLR